MFRTATQNRIGYGALAVGVVIGLFFSYKNDSAIKDVNRRQTTFILQQCERDRFRNKTVIEALESAKERARDLYKFDPIKQSRQLTIIQSQIDAFEQITECRLPE